LRDYYNVTVYSITLGKKQDIVYNGMGNSKTIKIWEEF